MASYSGGGYFAEHPQPENTVAMEKVGWLGLENCRQMPVEPWEPVARGGWKKAVLRGEAGLGFEPAVGEKIGPSAGGVVILGKGAHVVVVIETEEGCGRRDLAWEVPEWRGIEVCGGRSDAMQCGKLFPQPPRAAQS